MGVAGSSLDLDSGLPVGVCGRDVDETAAAVLTCAGAGVAEVNRNDCILRDRACKTDSRSIGCAGPGSGCGSSPCCVNVVWMDESDRPRLSARSKAGGGPLLWSEPGSAESSPPSCGESMTASTMRERRFPGVLWRREARPIVAAADGGALFTLERLALRLSLALLGGRPTTIQGSPSTGLGAPAKMSMTLLDNSCLGAG